jgi:hypothetical protein
LSAVSAVRVDEELLVYTHATLREYSGADVEAMVLWAGRMSGPAAFEVSAVKVPAQRALRTDSGLAVIIDSDELHRLNVWLYQHNLRLIAQLHTHPAAAFHSETDDAIPVVATRGALSLVVPDFARGPADIETYAVYRLAEDDTWCPVDRPVSSLIHVLRSEMEA